MINRNLQSLRKLHGYSQEDVAQKVHVSRQAIAKWENGESMPDINNCMALSKLYGVSLDDLVNYSEEENQMPVPPQGKHIFGVVKVGDRGQIVIPKKARDIFKIKAGDGLVVMGDEGQGIALIKQDDIVEFADKILGTQSWRDRK